MPEVSSRIPYRVDQRALVHSARTAVAAVVSLLVARGLGLPEAYWATISTLIIMQSTLGAALTVSEQRLAGTALGAAFAALLATYFGSNTIVFASIRHWIDLRRTASRGGVPAGQRHARDCHAYSAHETGVDRRGSPVRRSIGGDRSGVSVHRPVAGRGTHGELCAAWFAFGVTSNAQQNYLVVVAAVACSRSTSLRRAALPRSARK